MKPQTSLSNADTEYWLTTVSRETIEDLKTFETLLRRWQKIKNLVAPSTMERLWQRHFADSAQLVVLRLEALRWVDLGSGAGFPGLIIAILKKSHSGAKIHLIESDHRKCAFLREVIRETGAPAMVHHGRIEKIVDSLEDIEIVTARALAALPELLRLAMPLLEKGAEGLFLKGQDVASELTKDPIFSRVNLNFLPSALPGGGHIVSVKRR